MSAESASHSTAARGVLLPLACANAQYRLEVAFLVGPQRRRNDQGNPERGVVTKLAGLGPEDVGLAEQLVELREVLILVDPKDGLDRSRKG